jgi:hypothetical protein
MSVQYATPAAFRRALTDRLRSIARPVGRWSLADLQRQFAYDRLLARMYRLDPEWIVKGAIALLAREIAVRHTVDLDVYRADTTHRAEEDLRTAAATDVGDLFCFESDASVPLAGGVDGVRVHVTARVGTAEWARFPVDLITDGVRMTGTPDDVPPLAAIRIPDLPRPGYRAYPLVDHIADKTCAIIEPHGAARHPSSRFKDLVDLVALASAARVTADGQRRALLSEGQRRGLTLPRRFDVPDEAAWRPGYSAEARRAAVPIATTLDEAVGIVRGMLDPVLDGTATGVWNPHKQAWLPP